MTETSQNVRVKGLIMAGLTLRHLGIPDGENRDLAKAGWNESFDKLEDYLSKDGFL